MFDILIFEKLQFHRRGVPKFIDTQPTLDLKEMFRDQPNMKVNIIFFYDLPYDKKENFRIMHLCADTNRKS